MKEIIIKTASEIIKALGLERHPGGCDWFKETYRNETQIALENFDGPRNISTCIYNLITVAHQSQLHKTKSDETVHYYYGNANLMLYIIEQGKLLTIELGPHNDNLVFQYHIPKDHWFVVEVKDKTSDAFVLSGYTVYPGFDFKDFISADRKVLCEKWPHLSSFISKFTPS